MSENINIVNEGNSSSEQELPNLEKKEASGLSKFSSILRTVGAGALALAATTFIVQGMDFEAPFSRILNFGYLLLAVYALGVFCALVVKEPKSARVGMAVGIGMIPAIAMQFSAICYASINVISRDYPKYLRFSGFEGSGQIAISIVGAVLFGILTYVAIKALAAQGTKSFALAYLIGVVALVMPLRGNLAVFFLAGLPLAYGIWKERTEYQKNAYYNTLEASYLRLMMFAPVLLILLRNLVLYNEGSISLSLVFGALAAIFGFVTSQLKPDYYIRSKVVAIFCTFMFWVLLIEGTDLTIFADYRYYIAYLPVMFYLMNLRARFPSAGPLCLLVANCCLAIIIFAQQWINGSMMDTSLSLLLCGAALTYSWTAKDQLTMVVSTICLLSLLGRYWELVMQLYKLNPWMFMGICGILAILLASYVEKNADKIKNLYSRFRK